MRNMRILVANSPRMYREALALAVLKRFPDAEMLIGPPDCLDGQAKRLKPQIVVRNADEQDVGIPEGVVCCVEVSITDGVDANISMGGRVTKLQDATMEELLAALDEAAEKIRTDGGEAGTS